jgi:flagellar biosynthesis/type III secretory pathway M-ring protein FliF/YscJ
MKSVMTLPPPPKAVGYDPILQLSAPAAIQGLAPPAVDPEEVARAMSAQQSAKMNEWLDDARNLAQDDPRRLAQLTRQWMNTDG